MDQKGLSGFFEGYLKRESIFSDKHVLQSNYTPENILHREQEIKQIAQMIAPSLKKQKISNIFIYGQTGTGKTSVIRHITDEMNKVIKENSIELTILYLNCKLRKVADTEYRLIAQLSRDLGKDVPITGLPTDEIYKTFFSAIDAGNRQTILVLDEVDHLVKKVGDGVLYNFTRINTELKLAQLSIIGISNDLVFADHLDPRVRSSLSEEEVAFAPYNALQLQEILKGRSSNAFRPGVVSEGVIEKCAAHAAREHGDARRALELLRVAAEIADRDNAQSITISHIDAAEDKIEYNRVLDIIRTQPKQHQATLYAILTIGQKRQSNIFTGEVYELYTSLCNKIGMPPLTQRRTSDIISEFDMLGIINAKVISKGRYGRTREISLHPSFTLLEEAKKLIEGGLDIA